MIELWEDIKGYEGRYKISNKGRVKSLINNKGNFREKILKPSKDKDGYLQVGLSKNGIQKTKRIHQLVAKAFIKNPCNYPLINHKDENKSNNNVDNLEWCTVIYNNNYGTRNKRLSKSLSKLKKGVPTGKCYNYRKVICLNNLLVFNNSRLAGEYGGLKSRSKVNECASGKLKHAGKHPETGEKLSWMFLDEYNKEEII